MYGMGKRPTEKQESLANETNAQKGKGSVARRSVLKGAAIAGGISLVGFPHSVAASTSPESECNFPGFDCGEAVSGENGMVVSDHAEASKIGARILREGGNAVDAVAAVHFALNVATSPMCGIGGGGTMVYYDASEDEVISLDFYPRAHADVSKDYWLEDGEPVPFEV